MRYDEFFSYLMYSCFVYATIKFAIFIIITFGGVDADSILQPLKELIPGVVYSKFFYSSWMYRLATSSDIVLTLVFCILLIDYERFKYIYGDIIKIFLPIMLIMILQTYTRALWLMVVFTFFSRLSLRNILLLILSLMTVAVILPLLLPNDVYAGITDVVSARATDTGSLDAKFHQSIMLFNEFLKYPLMGKGSGSFVDGYIRSYEQKFQYENQIFAFLMQFGILGFTLLFAVVIFIFFRLYNGNAKVIHHVLFALFIFSGFTNPNLIIVVSSLVYCLFVFYDDRLLFYESKLYR
ncbi:O-antigen ligase family protein [Vibrio alfacsensis]|uniref:O-antigen ligase family protein n=1 Tax=Vibrio alfacsensis TaxID=1074311 RepID=UPI001C824209|nr:O-antigen ligase family protein [Vibrio alfacsensis]